MQPLFKRTSQAIHFAYIIEAYPVSPQSTLLPLVSRAMREMGETPEHSGINFKGMTAGDIRHECEKIRHAVLIYLPTLEAKALEARFATKPGIQNAAIDYMAEYMVGQFDLDANVLRTLTCRHYLPTWRRDITKTYRSIAAQYYVSKDRVARIAKRMEVEINLIEQAAFTSLQGHFEKVNWVKSQERIAA